VNTPGLRTLRRWLLAGLVVTAPVGVTVIVLLWLFRTLDGILGEVLSNVLGFRVPGLGLLLLVLILLAAGWATERAIGSRVLGWWHDWLERLPLISRLYGASSRIVRTVFGGGKRFFRGVVLIQYPSPGRWSIGFVTSDTPSLLTEQVEDATTVFVPTAPNPTSGFLVIIPRRDTIPLPMSVEDGFTFILSAGAVAPAPAGAPLEPEPGP